MPTISAITPSSAPAGASVRIDGTGFVNGARVVFGTTAANSVTFVSSTQLEVVVPDIGAETVSVTVINPDTTSAIYTGFVILALAGWGDAAFGRSPYGGSAIGAVSISGAVALGTRTVAVTVTGLVQDNSPFLEGDALNPSTWTVQRLDTAEMLHVVGVEQLSALKYSLLTLEEFGAVDVTHRVSTGVLRDESGALISTPRQADFLGVQDANKTTAQAVLAHRRSATRDLANAQVAPSPYTSGTLQLDAAGDYKTVTGVELLKKLVLRRLMSKPGDFFHLPDYGVGIQEKAPLPTADLTKLKARIEQQVLNEPEIESVKATLLMDPGKGILYVTVAGVEKKTGGEFSVSVPVKTSVV